MARIAKVIALLVLAVLLQTISQATTVKVNPSDDGSIYTCTGCDPTPNHVYVTVSGYIVGDIDFSTAKVGGNVQQALLSVNPYSLPLLGPSLEVYGLASSSATISKADLTSPVFLGTWTLPANLNYGQDAFYDVTSFLQTVHTPYVDFILEDAPGGTDAFSSLQHNYGHPSQLEVTVPEPASFSLLVVGILAVTTRNNRQQG